MKSVRSQQGVEVEHIIIDGGSTDATCELVKSSNAKLVIEHGSSIYEALNKGISVATGQIICFLNADDEYFDDKVLATISKVFTAENNTDIVYGDCRFVDIDGNCLYDFYPPKLLKLPNSSLRVFNVSHPSWFIRKNVFESIGGYDENLFYIADCDFILRCIRSNKAFTYVNQKFAKFTLHRENASRSKRATRELKEYFIKMHGPAAYKRFYGNILLACAYVRDIRYFFYRLKRLFD